MDVSDDDRDSNAPVDSASDGDDDYEQEPWARKLFDESRHATDRDTLASVFDAYFNEISRPSRTSNNLFSQLVTGLSQDDFQARLREVKRSARSKNIDKRVAALEDSHRRYFPAFLDELASGFNLLFYGFGSKRNLLNAFARSCAKKGHVVVGNAFFTTFTLKEYLSSTAHLIDAPEVPDVGVGPEGQCRRILAKYTLRPHARHIFLIIHNIDGPNLRSERPRTCLRQLASHPSIHIVASVDHIAASTLFSTTDTFSREAGFSWLWHDCTTMRAYDFENAYADRTSYAGASLAYQQRNKGLQGGGIGGVPGGIVSENAAKHVLASVTAKAKKLFALLCAKQRAAIDAAQAEAESGTVVLSSPEVATSYEFLFNAAREEFIATSDTAMRALLGEFRDHSLVLSATALEGGEALWIPLSKDALMNLSKEIE